MELFTILLAPASAFVAVSIYAQALPYFLRVRGVRRLFVSGSRLVMTCLALEWVLLLAYGARSLQAALGPLYYGLHVLVFLLSVPALANILLIREPDGQRVAWPVAAFWCAVLALPVVLTQYGVSEALDRSIVTTEQPVVSVLVGGRITMQ